MCLILVAWKVDRGLPLVVAANRDEYHARPAVPADYWRDRPAILAGRDLQAGGTWLGISRRGRFASVTNYRGGFDPQAKASRGALVADFLDGAAAPEDYVRRVEAGRSGYSGFNLLVADADELWWISNRADGPRRLSPGVHALGNDLLDTPEVQDVKERFARAPAAVEPLFALLSTAKIVAPSYGTRCSTVLRSGAGGRLQFAERPYDAGGTEGPTRRFEFDAA